MPEQQATVRETEQTGVPQEPVRGPEYSSEPDEERRSQADGFYWSPDPQPS